MPLYAWKPEFSVNIKIIDQQHRRLVDSINNLHDAMKTAINNDVVSKIVEDLTAYADTHFITEEDFFVQYGYPKLEAHKREHDRFRAKAAEFKKQLQEGHIALSIDMSMFLFDWLNDHILKMDKAYTAFLNAKGVV